MRLAHHRFRLAAHSRGLLVPVVGATFLLVGAFYPGPTDPYEAWGFCAVFFSALTAWVVFTIERAVPPQADAMLVARSGGTSASRRANMVLVAEVAVLLASAFLVIPAIAGVVSPLPAFSDVAYALAGLALSAGFGGALALTFGTSMRGGMAFVIVVIILVALSALVSVVPAAAGPVEVGRELSHLEDGREQGAMMVSIAVTAAYTAGLFALARRLRRWRG